MRNVLRQRARTALTLASIVLGVAGLILAGGFVEDVYVQLGEATIRSQLGHLQVYRKGFYAQGSRKPLEFAITEPSALVQQLRAHSAVQDVMLRLNFSGLLNNGRADLAVVGEGIEPEKEARLGSFVTILEGRPLDARDVYGVLIGEGVSKALKLPPGARTTLVANTVDGGLNSIDLEVVGVFRSFSKDYDDRAVRIALEAAHELLAAKIANAAVVLLDATSRTNEVKAEFEKTLSAGNVEVKAWYELSDFYEKTIELYKRQFGALQLIVFFMVALSVTNSVSITIFERVGEFGTMQALGDRARRIYFLIVMESALVGLAGAAAGAGLGILLAMAISIVGIPMPPVPNAETGYTAFIRVVPSVVILAFSIGLTAAIAAALWVARRVVRVRLVDALRANV